MAPDKTPRSMHMMHMAVGDRTDAASDAAGSLFGDAVILVACGVGLAFALLVVVPANVGPLWLAVGLPAAGARIAVGLLGVPSRRRAARAVSRAVVPSAASILADLRIADGAAPEILLP